MPENPNASAAVPGVARPTQLEASRSRKRRGQVRALGCCVVFALAAWAAALILPMTSDQHDFLSGVAAGLAGMILVFGLLLLLGRRGHGGALPRMLTGEVDERDEAVWLRAWQATGMAAFAGVLLSEIVIVFGAPPQAPLAILSFALVVVLYGSHAVLDRRM